MASSMKIFTYFFFFDNPNSLLNTLTKRKIKKGENEGEGGDEATLSSKYNFENT